MTARSLLAALFGAGLLAAAGCAGYRLGSMLPGDLRSVHVPGVVNRTDEPLLEAEVRRALLARIQFDGTLRVADAESADSELSVELIGFRTEAIAFLGEQDASPDEYRARIDARFVLVNRRTGEVVSRGQAIGESTFEGQGDLLGARAEGIPPAARDLARRLVSQVVEAW